MIILNTMSRNIKIDIKKSPNYCSEILEAPPGFGPGVKELQSFALPLGYSAVLLKAFIFYHKSNTLSTV